MKNDGFKGAEIRGDDGTPVRLRDGPLHNFEGRFVPQLGVGLGDLVGCNF
jgi:hypothetical protein